MDIQVGTIGRFKLNKTSKDAIIEGIIYKIIDERCIVVCSTGEKRLVEKAGAKSIASSLETEAAYKAVLESIQAVDYEKERHQQAMFSLASSLSAAQNALLAATGTMLYLQFSKALAEILLKRVGRDFQIFCREPADDGIKVTLSERVEITTDANPYEFPFLYLDYDGDLSIDSSAATAKESIKEYAPPLIPSLKAIACREDSILWLNGEVLNAETYYDILLEHGYSQASLDVIEKALN